MRVLGLRLGCVIPIYPDQVIMLVLVVVGLTILLTILSSPTSAFVVVVNFESPPTLATTGLKMSTAETSTKPEIEVIPQAEKEFLEKKGVCK